MVLRTIPAHMRHHWTLSPRARTLVPHRRQQAEAVEDTTLETMVHQTVATMEGGHTGGIITQGHPQAHLSGVPLAVEHQGEDRMVAIGERHRLAEETGGMDHQVGLLEVLDPAGPRADRQTMAEDHLHHIQAAMAEDHLHHLYIQAEQEDMAEDHLHHLHPQEEDTSHTQAGHQAEDHLHHLHHREEDISPIQAEHQAEDHLHHLHLQAEGTIHHRIKGHPGWTHS